MQYSDQVIVKRWIPILKEYERTKAKVNPRTFKFIKNLCDAHHIFTLTLTVVEENLLSRKTLSALSASFCCEETL